MRKNDSFQLIIKLFILLFLQLGSFHSALAENKEQANFRKVCVYQEDDRRADFLGMLGGVGIRKFEFIEKTSIDSRDIPIKGDTLSSILYYLKLSKDGSCYTYPKPLYYVDKEINRDKDNGEIVISVRAYASRTEVFEKRPAMLEKDMTKDIAPHCPTMKMPEKRFGLVAYQTTGSCLQTWFDIYDRYIFFNAKGKSKSFISCPRNKRGRTYLMCTHWFFYNDKEHNCKTTYLDHPVLYFKISYQKMHLPYWQEIENAVRQHFDSISYNPCS